LALACWIINEENPLTRRVVVNRIWETLFGTGLVRTSDDFGTRGELPSHPELLDWLAINFQRDRWSLKRTIRTYITSSTYRLSSTVGPDVLDVDPRNRLLSRAARFRVDAEVIRDLTLNAAGLLSTKLGGPSVYPWQPPGTSERLEFAGFQWKVNEDENRHRRGIYTHWKRTSLYPSFKIFDAPNRTSTCSRRDCSTTPLQALVTLNDPVFFEAAVRLGQRMVEEAQGDLKTRLVYGFRLSLSRQPTTIELETLSLLLEEELERARKSLQSAVEQLGGEQVIQSAPHLDVVEWAAYTTIANVLLNLDETMTRE